MIVGGGLINWWVNETHVCMKGKYILECRIDFNFCMPIIRRVDAAFVSNYLKLTEQCFSNIKIALVLFGNAVFSILVPSNFFLKWGITNKMGGLGM